jgi:tRNA A37 N6-isopentenylltransferase MiaA
MAPPPRVLVLAGPTAIGKSALALRLCEQLPGELISVDSVQVYRGLQIGSAKPSAEERGRVRHHLLDIRDPTDEYTAGSFYRDALHAVQDVLSRGNTPVLVGGTMMYMRWLAHGRPGAPKSDPEIAERVRQRLEPFESAGDWEAGLAVLQELDAARCRARAAHRPLSPTARPARSSGLASSRPACTHRRQRGAALPQRLVPPAPRCGRRDAGRRDAAGRGVGRGAGAPLAARAGQAGWVSAMEVAVAAAACSDAAHPCPLPPRAWQALDAFRASLDFRAFFLSGPRLPLCERIDSRCCAMLEGGLLEEVTGGTAGVRAQTSSPTPTHPNTPTLGR